MQGYLEFAAAEQALLAVGPPARPTLPPHSLSLTSTMSPDVIPIAAALLDRIVGEISGWGVTVVTVDPGGRRLLHAPAEFASVADALTRPAIRGLSTIGT